MNMSQFCADGVCIPAEQHHLESDFSRMQFHFEGAVSCQCCWRDGINLFLTFRCRDTKVIVTLQIKPEFRACSEILPQAQASVSRDASCSLGNCVDSRRRNMNVQGKPIQGDAHWFQRILMGDFAGNHWKSMRDSDKLHPN